MTKPNPANERIKRDYLTYLAEALGRDEATIDTVAKAIARFEESTGRRDFNRFHREQAVAFKKRLADAVNLRTGERLSKSTLLSTLRDLRAFFFWLAHQPGFKKRIAYADADYFNLSDRDVAIARARREKRVPTLDQVEHVLSVMPFQTVVERRDRALVALAMLTGARVRALASLQLGQLDVADGFIDQDARSVRTKFGKSFRTYFMLVSERAPTIVKEWVIELKDELLWSATGPLFPSTVVAPSEGGAGFVPVGLAKTGWTTSSPIRDVFRKAFAASGLPYFNPHSFRDMLVAHALSLDLPAGELKAWSQNLGHADLLTTLRSYGQLPTTKQGELVKAAARRAGTNDLLDDPDVIALIAKIKSKAAS